MVSKKVTIVNPSGLHLRPAGVLYKTAMKFKCSVKISSGGNVYEAKSVLGIMSAEVKCGAEIEVICDGEDEAEALEKVTEAIESGLEES